MILEGGGGRHKEAKDHITAYSKGTEYIMGTRKFPEVCLHFAKSHQV